MATSEHRLAKRTLRRLQSTTAITSLMLLTSTPPTLSLPLLPRMEVPNIRHPGIALVRLDLEVVLQLAVVAVKALLCLMTEGVADAAGGGRGWWQAETFEEVGGCRSGG